MEDFLKLKDTEAFELIEKLDAVYKTIEEKQSEWLKVSLLNCPEACGSCCVNFEPDITEAESLYLAYFLLTNQREKADSIVDGSFISLRKDNDKGCILFNPDSPYHCTVYAGRCLICRIFGYSGDTGKNGERRWKPCRFYPQEKLSAHKPPLAHKQYSEEELKNIFPSYPPAMSELMQQALSILPGDQGATVPLREALPPAIRKLKFLYNLVVNQSEENK